jgi:membrane fusion protein (multidrug efflux system)
MMLKRHIRKNGKHTAALLPRLKAAGFIGLGLFLLILAAGCNDGTSDAQAAPEEQPGVKIDVEVVKPRLLRDVMILPGNSAAVNDVRLAAETDGQVHWIGVKEGQSIKAGDLVAKIDVDSRKAVLQSAQSAHELAKSKTHRRKQLYAKKAVPREELDSSLTELQAALSRLKEAEIAYTQGFVRSPISGVINRVYVDPGEFIKRGEPVVEIVDVANIRIKCFAPEMDVSYLKTGQKALVRVDALTGEQWVGTIEFVSFKADQATKTFEVWVRVDNSNGMIRPGMISRTAFIRREISDAITAPLSALVDKGGERILFVEKDGKAQARQVEMGVIDGERIQILKGLKQGDNLIVVGQTELEEGMKVITK